MKKPILSVRRLSVTFRAAEGPARAVDEAAFSLYSEEILALIGETGCGKSVIAQALAGLTPQSASISGEIIFKNRNILTAGEKELEDIRRRDLALILQNPSLALNPVHPVWRQLANSWRPAQKISRAAIRAETLPILEAFGFEDPRTLLKLFPHQLSGGMAQRVLTAAAVLRSPSVLIADEPTKGLDAQLADAVIKALITAKNLHASALLLISHDLRAAERIADRIAVMYAGDILETAPADDFFKLPLHPYSRLLLGSLPKNDFRPIAGISPALTEMPRGCRFHPRCPSARQSCREEKPPEVHNGKREVRCILYS
jgi:peptide/nickel transport system ATP-binding protein